MRRVDDDIDVYDDDQITWAMATRFNADKDLFIPSRKLQAFYADPNADADDLVSKVGFDLTSPTSRSKEIRFARPVHWIVSLFGEKVIPLSFGNVTAGNTTYGHRFLAPAPIPSQPGTDAGRRRSTPHLGSARS